MKTIDKNVIITGILCLTLLEIVAILMGFNGILLRTVMVVIAAAIGITLPTPKIIGGK